MTTDITQLDAQRQPIDDAAEAERDQLIEIMRKKSARADAVGNYIEASRWNDAIQRAIAARTPAHKARLESEHMARVEASRCHFDVTGEADAKRLEDGA